MIVMKIQAGPWWSGTILTLWLARQYGPLQGVAEKEGRPIMMQTNGSRWQSYDCTWLQ